MKILAFMILITISSLSTIAQEPIEGIWNMGKDNTKIEIYPKDGTWFGQIISSDNPKAKVGTDILINFKKKGASWEGQIYAVKKDKLVNAVIEPVDNKLLVEVTAGIFTKNMEWLKVYIKEFL